MNTTVQTWRFECYALVPHPSEPRILLLMEDDAYALPGVEVISASADDAFAQMLRQFAHELGGSVTVLRSIARHVDEAARHVVELLVMEHQRAARLPASARWLSREDLARRPLAQREQQVLIEHELREAEAGGMPPLRAR